MPISFLVALALIVALVTTYLVWRRRQRNRSRLISFVALLREPSELDAAVIARIAGKVWGADLGDGTSEGEDGFIAGVGPMTTIMHEGRMFLINCVPRPYVEQMDEAAASITDLRIRNLFQQHLGWISCDAIGVDASTAAEDVQDLYCRLGKLFVEFLDPSNALLIFLPDANLAFPINEDTEAALRSRDPIRSLQETLTVPIIEVSDDDPLMKQAVEKARESWSEFVESFERQKGENFAVKSPVTHSGNTEFIWISVTSVEGEKIYGTLANDPNNLGPLKLGSKVSVPVADLNDWCFVDAGGKMHGGFTIEAVSKAAKRKRG